VLYARLAGCIGAGFCRLVRLTGVIAFASRYRPSPGRVPLQSEHQKRSPDRAYMTQAVNGEPMFNRSSAHFGLH
jgi:hypothetical protein